MLRRRMDLTGEWRNDCVQRKIFRIFHRPNSHPPPRHFYGQRGRWRGLVMELGLVCSFCLLFLCSGEMRDIFRNLFFLDCGERKSNLYIYFFFLSSLTGLTAANRLLAKSTQIRKRQVEVRENSRVPIYNDGEKKTTVRWKEKNPEKSLWNV